MVHPTRARRSQIRLQIGAGEPASPPGPHAADDLLRSNARGRPPTDDLRSNARGRPPTAEQRRRAAEEARRWPAARLRGLRAATCKGRVQPQPARQRRQATVRRLHGRRACGGVRADGCATNMCSNKCSAAGRRCGQRQLRQQRQRRQQCRSAAGPVDAQQRGIGGRG
eukprot:SAG31_NODE_1498_length_8095_cov_9.582541_7_plen_168_part_00